MSPQFAPESRALLAALIVTTVMLFPTLVPAYTPWTMFLYDTQGTNYNSEVTGTATEFEPAFSQPPAGWDATVFVGDVNGDNYGEIVQHSGGIIYVYDRFGNTLNTIDVSSLEECRMGLLVDLDDDGMHEIGVGFHAMSYYWECRFYNLDGTIALSFQMPNPGDDARCRPLAQFDNGDLFLDYGAIWGGGGSAGRRGMIRWSLAYNQEVWNYTTGSYNHSVMLYDIDNDGLMEMTSCVQTSHNGAYGNGWNGNATGTTDGQLYTLVFAEDGTEQYTLFHGGEDGWLFNSLVDFNDDGIYEVLSKIGHDTYYHGYSHLELYDQGGNLVASRGGVWDGSWGYERGSVIADLNGDGAEECVVSNYSFETGNTYTLILGPNLALIDSFGGSGYSGEIAIAADLMSQPGIELVIRDGATLKVVDTDFNVLWSVTKDAGLGQWIRAADLDSDGQAELIFEADSLYVYRAVPAGGIRDEYLRAEAFDLPRVYPNPFNPSTVISFELRAPSFVKLEVFDVNGRAVESAPGQPLREEWMTAGEHQVTFDGSGLAAGVYIYRLEAGELCGSGKMVLLK